VVFKKKSAPVIGTLFFLCQFLICVGASELQVSYPLEGRSPVVAEQRGSVYVFSQGNSERIRAVTLNWPPYIGESLCDKGWVFRLAVATVIESGFDLEIKFLPWARAVREAEQGTADILFPEYFIEDSAPSDNVENTARAELLALSSPFNGGSIGLTKLKSHPFTFDGNLRSLQTRMIGVVRGYQNTPEFDRLMDANQLRVTEVIDDRQLVRLLINKRVDLIVGDPLVFDGIFDELYNSKGNGRQTENLSHLLPSLGYKDLYFAVSKKATRWQQLLEVINATLEEFKSINLVETLQNTSFERCRVGVETE